jgi:hypothetical protein
MATDHSGKNKHQRAGRTTPHGTGEREPDTSSPGEQQADTESGARREAPPEYQDEGSDVPGLRKKIR